MSINKVLTTEVSILIASVVIAVAIYAGIQRANQQNASTSTSLIEYEEISARVPTDYQIYEYYYVNLDDDKNDEILVLLEEEENYTTEKSLGYGIDIDYFREKPVEIMVFDFINDVWVRTEPVIVSSSRWKGQHFFKPYNYSDPYRIISKQDDDWVVILTGHASVHAFAISPSIFTYSEKDGLQRVEISEDLWGENVFMKDDYLYFISCNPFTDKNMESYELDLSGHIPKQRKIYLNDKISCDFIWKYSTNEGAYGGFIDNQQKIEALFNIKGIYFPIE